MNNKGFTLVEVLVAVAISSLILMMAIPSIGNMVRDTRNNEFSKYKDSIIQAAKLYYDQKGEDLYWIDDGAGNELSSVTFRQLEESGFVKKFTANPQEGKKRCNVDLGEVDNVIVELTRVKTANSSYGNQVSGKGTVTYEVLELRCGTTKLELIK